MLSFAHLDHPSDDDGDVAGKAPAGARPRARRRRPIRRSVADAPFPLPRPAEPAIASRAFDITAYGAVPGADSSAAIAAAIAACAEAGGGRVIIPDGQWLTGPIHLRSNIDLHLAAKASLIFSTDPSHYLPPVFVRWGGVECYNLSPLIYARDCSNIAITGKGSLHGRGDAWWGHAQRERASYEWLYRMVLGGLDREQRCAPEADQLLLPQFIHAIGCSNILLEDVRIAEGGPAQSIHLAYCRNAIVRRVAIDAPDGPGNDGIKIDSSQEVLVEDCTLRPKLDCVSLDSGFNEDGWRVARPTENVLVRRVSATAGRAGIVIGSATAGGVRNVLVEDCTFDGTTIGIRFCAGTGRGGIVEEIHLRNIRMGCIGGEAIRMDLDSATPVSPAPRPPIFRNIQIRNLTCDDAQTAVHISGLPGKHFQNIRLEDLTIAAGRGLQCDAGQGIDLVNVAIVPRVGPVLSVTDSQEVLIQGLRSVPPEGVFLALRGRWTRGIRVRGEADSQVRPSIVLGADVPHDALVHE